MSTKKTAGEFVDVSSSGSVSVRLGDYLKSEGGKSQLRDIRTLSDYNNRRSSVARTSTTSKTKQR